jgi:hypothetical protein
MPDKSLPIIDLAYGLALELNRAVGDFPRNQRPGLGRRIEEAAFDLLAALVAARYRTGADKQARLARASEALDQLCLLVRMASDLRYQSLARYEELAKMEREIGRMLGGWQKSGAAAAGAGVCGGQGGRRRHSAQFGRLAGPCALCGYLQLSPAALGWFQTAKEA